MEQNAYTRETKRYCLCRPASEQSENSRSGDAIRIVAVREFSAPKFDNSEISKVDKHLVERHRDATFLIRVVHDDFILSVWILPAVRSGHR